MAPSMDIPCTQTAPRDTRSLPPLLSFLLNLCVIVLHTHTYHPPKFGLNPKHCERFLLFCPFRACLLAALCLLFAGLTK